MKSKLVSILAIALFCGPMAANALLIASYGTGSTGSVVGGTLTSGLPVSDTNNAAYFQGPTTPASNWVWTTDPTGFAAINFVFSFDLTGYDPNTASLSAIWGIDNIGTATLNGNLLSSLPNVGVGNFNTLTAFSANQGSLFNPGINSLVFSVSNQGGPGAFRSAGTVNADLANPVSEPVSLMLLGLGLMGVGMLQRRKKPS
jgi:hypothetical protein